MIFKWVLDVPDAGLSSVIAVIDESAEAARDRAAAFARQRGLWGNWFLKQEPEQIPLDRAAVVAWAEFAR